MLFCMLIFSYKYEKVLKTERDQTSHFNYIQEHFTYSVTKNSPDEIG